MSIPTNLRRALQEGRLIPFAGAGVSLSAKNLRGKPLLPTWNGLLLAASERLRNAGKVDDAEHVRILADKNRNLEAALEARKALRGEWTSFLKDQIEIDTKDIDPESLTLPKALWALSPIVVTTNYDLVLKIAHGDPIHLNEWSIEAAAEQSDLLRDRLSRPTLWYLHGHIGNAAQIILTPGNYEELYGSERHREVYTAAKRVLEGALGSYTFLFVGFSFADEAVGGTLQAYAEAMKGAGGDHYAILPPAEARAVRRLDLPIEVIEAAHGDETLALLREMAGVAQSEAGEPAEAPKFESAMPAGPIADFSPKHPAFYVPYRQKGDQVVGRFDALAEVRRQLETGRPTSIGQAAAFTGLGGLGKTQLAVEYAYTYRDEYPSGVVWITADQEIEPQLIEAAEKARWVSPQSDHKSKLDLALHRVRTFDNGLVVFDNIENRADIQPYLPTGDATPHLLLTSRSAVSGFTPVSLGTLDPEDAYTMLVQEANRLPEGNDDEAAARAIVARLDGLPLAIELAGAYLRYRPAATYTGYLEMFEEGATRALSRGDLDSFTQHDADVASALVLHDRLIEDAPALPTVLKVLTWSASAAMSRSLLQAILPDVSPADLREALDLGESLRLLRSVPDTDRYAIHRLVAEVRREGEAPAADWVAEVARRVAEWFKERRNEFRELEAYEADLDHLDEWTTRVEPHDQSLAARLMWLQAYPPFHRGQPDLILDRLKKARDLFDASNVNDPELDAHLLHDFSTALGMGGASQPSALSGRSIAENTAFGARRGPPRYSRLAREGRHDAPQPRSVRGGASDT
ncbi:hypothetical protein BH23BAC4_BH23BAC4_05390 [soil metagenome]